MAHVFTFISHDFKYFDIFVQLDHATAHVDFNRLVSFNLVDFRRIISLWLSCSNPMAQIPFRGKKAFKVGLSIKKDYLN